jgi:hypothetical protein
LVINQNYVKMNGQQNINFRTTFADKIKTHVLYSMNLAPKSYHYEIMREKSFTAAQALR